MKYTEKLRNAGLGTKQIAKIIKTLVLQCWETIPENVNIGAIIDYA